MPLVDIGANLTHSAFDADLDEVLARARRAGVAQVVVTGTTVEESRHAATLADSHPGMLYATAGVHPHHARECTPQTLTGLRELSQHPRCVAIGECGLDFNRNYSPHPDQEKWFVAQLELGIELGKPLFLHSRDAHPRFSEILKHHKIKKAVAHCFTGAPEELKAYLDLGLYIGITGWICDERRGKHLLELVKEIPKDRLLLETDSPYLTPRDLRPQPRARRNEPAFLPHILHTVARALGRPAEEVAAETARNARDLFSLHESGSSAAAKRPLAA
jgi:TatD DNase family protein